MTQSDLNDMTVAQLKELARSHNLSGYSRLRKAELICFIQQQLEENFDSGVEERAADEQPAHQPLDVAHPQFAAGESETPDVGGEGERVPVTSGVRVRCSRNLFSIQGEANPIIAFRLVAIALRFAAVRGAVAYGGDSAGRERSPPQRI